MRDRPGRLLGNAPPGEDADVRPTLLGVVTLLFLLLFFLFATSGGVRLGQVPLRLASDTPWSPPDGTGALAGVLVQIRGADAEVRFAVATTDVAAASETYEQRVLDVPGQGGALDLAALGAAIERAHAVDPSATRARVVPDPATSAAELFGVLDAVRGSPGAPRFPRVTLGEP